jgi:hypothetical protein
MGLSNSLTPTPIKGAALVEEALVKARQTVKTAAKIVGRTTIVSCSD